jgi:hypothetical protein
LLPGSPPGKKEARERFRVAEELFDLGQKRRPPRGVLQIEIRRNPGPVIEPVAVADLAHGAIHLAARHLHHRRFPVVVKRDRLDAVGPEESQLPNVLLHLRDAECVVRIGLWPVSQLMASDGVGGRGPDRDRIVDREPALSPIEFPQQVASGEQRSAAGCGRDSYGPALDAYLEAFGRRCAAGEDNRLPALRRDSGRREVNSGSLLNLFHEHGRRYPVARRRDHNRVTQIDGRTQQRKGTQNRSDN